MSGIANFCKKYKHSLLFGLTFALAHACVAQELPVSPNPPAGHSPFADYVEYLKNASIFGAVLTATFAIVKQILEWSANARRKRRVEAITSLSGLVLTLDSAGAQSVNGSHALYVAKEELKKAIVSYAKSKQPLSRLRRIFLLYLPLSWDDWVYHFMFYTSTALLCLYLGSQVTDHDETDSTGTVFMLSLVLFGLSVFAQRGSALRMRQRSGIFSIPSVLPMNLRWHRANNFFGLLANTMLVGGISGLALSFFSLSVPQVVIGLSRWQDVIRELMLCSNISLGYLWAETEFSLVSDRILPQTVASIWESIRSDKNPFAVLSLIALTGTGIWTLSLFARFFTIPIYARFPDDFGEPVGAFLASIPLAAVIFFSGIMPMLAVYRGMSALVSMPRNERDMDVDGIQHPTGTA